MRLYIAGPMTGLPEFNYPAFFAAADLLAEVGIESINPARTEGREGMSEWRDFMRASLRDLADCDGIVLLPGWQNSRGAAMEYRIGLDLDLPVKRLQEWLDEAAEVAS